MKAPYIYFCTNNGTAYGIVPDTAINFGSVFPEQTSAEIAIYIQNDDEFKDLVATEIDCIRHPYDLQMGFDYETYEAVEFSISAGGNYTKGNPLAFGTCWADYRNGPFYAKWSPPKGAYKGLKVWGIMISGNYE